MKEIVKTFVIIILSLLVVLLSIKTEKCHQETRKQSQPVIITDTLTNVVYDTLFIDHFETVKLPVVDTVTIINDSLRIDSVFVEVPISVYRFDTTFFTDTTVFNLSIQNSGYAVTLDTLSFNFKYTPTHQKSNFFKEHFKFGVGIGTGFGVFSKKPDVFLSIGVYYCF